MAVLQKILDVLPPNEEKRRFQRLPVNLLGRYMLADRREFPCQVLDMSPGGMRRSSARWAASPASGSSPTSIIKLGSGYIDKRIGGPHAGRNA